MGSPIRYPARQAHFLLLLLEVKSRGAAALLRIREAGTGRYSFATVYLADPYTGTNQGCVVEGRPPWPSLAG